MPSTWYRVQTADRDVTQLLDPEHWISEAWSGAEAHERRGISVCASLEDLAHYLALGTLPIGADEWVVVELTGPLSTDRPVDADLGEYLLLPDTIVSVRTLDEAGMWDLIDQAYEALYA